MKKLMVLVWCTVAMPLVATEAKKTSELEAAAQNTDFLVPMTGKGFLNREEFAVRGSELVGAEGEGTWNDEKANNLLKLAIQESRKKAGEQGWEFDPTTQFYFWDVVLVPIYMHPKETGPRRFTYQFKYGIVFGKKGEDWEVFTMDRANKPTKKVVKAGELGKHKLTKAFEPYIIEAEKRAQ